MDCSVHPPPAYYYEMVKPYRDSFGLITQHDFDGGDTAHRTGLFYLGLYLNYKDNPKAIIKIKEYFKNDLGKIEYDTGKFVRHPDKNMWYSNPKNFSRDQNTPLIVALGFFEEKESIRGNLSQLIKGYGFYPNILKNWTNKEKVIPLDYRDFAGMSDWGSYIRALDNKSLYPLLLVSDTQLLGSSIIRFSLSYLDQDDSSDDINFSVHLIQSQLVMPTPLSKLASWFYKLKSVNKTHPESNSIFSYWRYYFTHGGRPPIDKLFECPIKEIFYDN